MLCICQLRHDYREREGGRGWWHIGQFPLIPVVVAAYWGLLMRHKAASVRGCMARDPAHARGESGVNRGQKGCLWGTGQIAWAHPREQSPAGKMHARGLCPRFLTTCGPVEKPGGKEKAKTHPQHWNLLGVRPGRARGSYWANVLCILRKSQGRSFGCMAPK